MGNAHGKKFKGQGHTLGDTESSKKNAASRSGSSNILRKSSNQAEQRKESGAVAVKQSGAVAGTASGGGRGYKALNTIDREEEAAEKRKLALKAAEARGNKWGKRISDKRKEREKLEKQQAEARIPQGGGASTTRKRDTSLNNSLSTADSTDGSSTTSQTSSYNATRIPHGFDPTKAIFTSGSTARQAVSTLKHGTLQNKYGTNGSHEDASLPHSGYTQVLDTLAEVNEMSETPTLDVAIQMMLSPDNADRMAVRTAFDTLLRILQNISEDCESDKYRRINLKNNKIQRKLLSVKGSVHVLRATGFCVLNENEKMILCLPKTEAYDEVENVLKSIASLQHARHLV